MYVNYVRHLKPIGSLWREWDSLFPPNWLCLRSSRSQCNASTIDYLLFFLLLLHFHLHMLFASASAYNLCLCEQWCVVCQCHNWDTTHLSLPSQHSTHLEAWEARILVEEIHLVGWQRAQDFLNDIQLIYLTFPRKEWLSITQFSHDAPYGPYVHCFAVGCPDSKRKHGVRVFYYSVRCIIIMLKLRCFKAAANMPFTRPEIQYRLKWGQRETKNQFLFPTIRCKLWTVLLCHAHCTGGKTRVFPDLKINTSQ